MTGPHLIAEVRFQRREVTCECGEVVRIPPTEFRPDDALAAAFQSHRVKVGAKIAYFGVGASGGRRRAAAR